MLVTEDHLVYLRQALDLAGKSPPRPTNFCVGAIVVSDHLDGKHTPTVLSTGYTLELPGNTHAEECALSKLAAQHRISESSLHKILTPEMNSVLYTTLEPCAKRLSGNLPCVNRILSTRGSSSAGSNSKANMGGIQKVVFGAKEPNKFVQDSESCCIMDEAGMEWVYLDDLQDQILKTARRGHRSQGQQ